MEKLFKLHIGLASKSPRRQLLLKEAQLKFSLIKYHWEETYPSSIPLPRVAPYLAKRKADYAMPQIGNCDLILTADSIVLNQGAILEKPNSPDEAVIMLQSLSEQTHTVITGVCLKSASSEELFSVETKVTFGRFSQEEITYYIKNFHPLDKAGSYGIQEWLGICKIKSIEGSYTNVMGLPMYETYHALKKYASDIPY